MSNSRPQRGGGAQYVEKAFAAKKIDVEDVINNCINEINLSALKVSQAQGVADMTFANQIYTALIINLDTFVYSLLTADEDHDWGDYETKRAKIKLAWPIAGAKPDMEQVRQLYSLTIKVLSRERLFKMRRWIYFGEGWKRDVKLNLRELEKEEDEENLDQEATP